MHFLLFFIILITACTSFEPSSNNSAAASIKHEKQEFCFSPTEPCDDKLVSFIGTSKKSLDIAVFSINRKKIIKAILDKHQTVKNIRIVMDMSNLEKTANYCAILRFLNVKISLKEKKPKAGYMHNKFTIVDGIFLETGSFNYTFNASKNNRENQLYLSNPNTVAAYSDEFKAIWDSGELITKAPEIKVPKTLEQCEKEDEIKQELSNQSIL